jgi:hypothetical protein
MKQCQNAEQFMLALSEHQTIQPVLVRVYKILLSANIPLKKHLTNPAVLLII